MAAPRSLTRNASPGVQALSRRAHRGRTRWLALAVVGALSLGTTAAQAWVRTRSETTEAAFFRSSPSMVLEVATPPDTLGIAPADVHAAAQAAASAWSHPAIDCTSLALTVAPGFNDRQAVAYDGHNQVILRTGAWCPDPSVQSNCHDPNQVALTTVFSRSHPGALDDGQILEADIEVNDVDYEWAIIPDGSINVHDYGNSYDLTSALTHETGHFIGLAHTCLSDGDPVRYDNHGAVSPYCNMLSGDNAAEILAATMYPTMNPVDVSLRSLSDDDVAAACSIYPAMTTVTGGCDVSSTPTPLGGAVAAGATAALAFAVARRRRAR